MELKIKYFANNDKLVQKPENAIRAEVYHMNQNGEIDKIEYYKFIKPNPINQITPLSV